MLERDMHEISDPLQMIMADLNLIRTFTPKWQQNTQTQKPHPNILNLRTPKEIGLKLPRWLQTPSKMAARL
jgi:hypothetical protein